MPSLASTLLLAAATASLHGSTAFVPSLSHCHSSLTTTTTITTTTSLNVGVSFDNNNDNNNNNEDHHNLHFRQLLDRATDCAKDEECSLEEWDQVMTEIEFVSVSDANELEHMLQDIHQLEERSAVSPWTSHLFARKDALPLVVLMFLASTVSTVTAPYDEIVIRIGWLFQDWSQVASTPSWSATASHLPLFLYVAGAYVALSEVVSCMVPFE